MITTPGHALTLGVLDLLGNDHTPGWWVEVTGEDADFGNPESIIRTVLTFLMDGAIENTDSHGNREMTFKLKVEGTSSRNLALAEAAVVAETEKRNLLTWTPPDNSGDFAGTPCEFRVANSTLDFAFDDLGELNLERIYTLTIKALPFAFSQDLTTTTTTPPVATTPTNTLVDNCSSTTGWSAASSSGTPTFGTSGGVITASETWPKGSAQRWIQVSRTGLSASMTSTPFVRIKMNYSISGGGDLSGLRMTTNINGPAELPVARDGDYYWFVAPSSPLTDVVVAVFGKFPNGSGALTLNIDEIYRTDTTSLSTIAGQRQQFVALPIGGSVRTPGNLTVVSAASALGSVLVYTNRDISGFQPDLRRRLRVSGGVPAETTDTSLVSQKSSPLSSAHQFLIPDVPPSEYVLYARLKHPSTGTYPVAWASDIVPLSAPSTPYQGTVGQSGTQSVSLTAGTWTIVPIAKMTLPPTTLADGGEVSITLSGPASLLLDEAWIFDADNGNLTQAELGSGTPAASGPYNELRLLAATLAATLDNPSPSAVVLGDGSNVIGAGAMLKANDPHAFVPDLMNVFVVTTGSVTTFMILEYNAAYHTHVVD